jgi:hypothetical protein
MAAISGPFQKGGRLRVRAETLGPPVFGKERLRQKTYDLFGQRPIPIANRAFVFQGRRFSEETPSPAKGLAHLMKGLPR